jgi:osmotically-inducible protein OsmY
LRPDLAYREVSSRTTETVARLIEKTARVRKLTPIQVTEQGDTLVLRGRVATRADRDLAENLARLEPGVWNLRNELVVGGEPGTSR